MSPLAKSGATWAVVMALLGLFFLVRYEYVRGLFTSITPTSPGICRNIGWGVEAFDLAVDAPHNTLFAADNYGLHSFRLDDLSVPSTKFAGMPVNFHPRSIDIYRASDGSETMFVLDVRPNGVRLAELFSLTYDGSTPKLVQQSAIQSRQMIDPAGVAAVASGQFYVTNAHVGASAPARFAEDYLLWAHADVLLYNGVGFRIAVQRIARPGGILAEGHLIYVAARNERRLIAFSREDFTGNLNEVGSLSLPARLENISADAAGNLIVAGETKPKSSQVFRVHLDASGIPQSYETVFSDDGHRFKGANAAVIQGGHLFISSADDNKIMDCQIGK